MTVVEPNRVRTTPAAGTTPPIPGPRGPVAAVPAGTLRQQVTYPQPGTAVLTVTGEIDAATAPRLDEMLQSRLCSQLARLVLDLSPVSFLGVSGVGTLQTAELRARASGATLLLVTGDNRLVTRALHATAGQHTLRWHTGPVAHALPDGGASVGQ